MKKRFGLPIAGDALPFSVQVVEQTSRNYICNVFGVLEHLSDVEETLMALDMAEETDFVTIRLNSIGGAHDVGDALIMAMNSCKAPIHVVASGVIASYATFVLLSAHSYELSPFTDILCHSASFGYGGKMKETKEAIDFQYKQAEKMIRHYYEGFFTPEEIDRIIGGFEHFMDAEEFSERYENRNKTISDNLET